MDIGSGTGFPSASLSNFFPHPFIIDGIQCNSMEGFLQSLKFKDIEVQKQVCLLVGKAAKFKGKKKKWWKTQTLFWQGKEIKRNSEEYQELLDRAFNALSKNTSFQKALLATGDAVLTHSIGKNKPEETVLTKNEFCSRLTKIRKRLQQKGEINIMFTLQSKTDEVIVYAETIEEQATGQIIQIANSPIGENAHIRIMPDAHAGKGCVIGTTMKYEGKICPNIVGVDIGCGVTAVKIDIEDVDLDKFDKVCREKIVSGRNVREEAINAGYSEFILDQLYCKDKLKNKDWIVKSLGTLGGGNHFIELNKGKDGYWLVVHTGSRNLGKQVAECYQELAEESLSKEYQNTRQKIIEELKQLGRQSEIANELSKLQRPPVTGLEYLEGENAQHYLLDMGLCQYWALVNRILILSTLLDEMNWIEYRKDIINSIHNYIDLDKKIIRKGAISAEKDQLCIIPLNMRDGSLICRGKGNPEWNYSAPHGAGRFMSRAKAKATISLEEFQTSMEGIASSSICQSTIDESPFAYKDMEEIMAAIEPTVEILERIVPVYNYKATD